MFYTLMNIIFSTAFNCSASSGFKSILLNSIASSASSVLAKSKTIMLRGENSYCNSLRILDYIMIYFIAVKIELKLAATSTLKFCNIMLKMLAYFYAPNNFVRF